jgi:hypothetical protein
LGEIRKGRLRQGKRMMRMGRKSSGEGEQWIVAQEKEGK